MNSLESFSDLIDEAAEKMTDKEFKEAVKKSTATLDRAIAAHSRRHGTAILSASSSLLMSGFQSFKS